MIRFARFEIDEIMPLVGKGLGKVEIRPGLFFNSDSQRLLVFKYKGINCTSCGLKGTHFWLQKSENESDNSFHMDLYATNLLGIEVLMTRDHIIPRCKGGPDTIKNQRPMCLPCNGYLGSLIDSPENEIINIKAEEVKIETAI